MTSFATDALTSFATDAAIIAWISDVEVEGRFSTGAGGTTGVPARRPRFGKTKSCMSERGADFLGRLGGMLYRVEID